VADDRKTKGSDIFLHSEDTPTTAAPPSEQPTSPTDPPPSPADSPPPDNSNPPADNAPSDNGSR
jgi:hypothetical protein